MGRGLIDVGTGYRSQALAGFVRESDEQRTMETANAELEAQKKMQRAKMGAEGVMMGGLGGYLLGSSSMVAGTETGASLGALAGPLGMIGGAAAGFLFASFMS